MSVYDHRPLWAGAHCDPVPAGGTVSRLDLYASPDRSGEATASVSLAVRLRPGIYRFVLPTVPAGRYWGTVTFAPNSAAQSVTDTSVMLDLPTGQGLVASPEAVADALGLPLPLTPAQRTTYETEIRNAQADVSAYLNRPIIPTLTTLRGLRPHGSGDLDDGATWALDLDDIAVVESYRSNPDGTYDVDLLVGLHGVQEDPVVRYVVAHAAEAIRQRPDGSGAAGRRVSSVSAEGQSVSYESTPATGQAGAPPVIGSLHRLRRLTFQPVRRPARAPWPYSSGRTRSRF
ncbi:hypothetical protein [Streptomyces sp. NPDC047981]|uniref:hypothetical protein n=1 Tax=Streptomyces sp. NPDC047981 TaxID=3154610 RepID=UPI00343CA4DC